MIKKVLEMICQGRTLAEIADEMNMEYSALVSMLEHMVNMGYLERGKREEKGACRTCPLNSVCAERNYTVYFLTEKGKKLVHESC